MERPDEQEFLSAAEGLLSGEKMELLHLLHSFTRERLDAAEGSLCALLDRIGAPTRPKSPGS